MTPESPRTMPPSRRRSRRLTGWLVAVLGLALSLAAFNLSLNVESKRLRDEFQLRAERNAQQLRRGLDRFSDIQAVLRLYFEHSAEVTRQEFEQVGRDLLLKYPGIQALQWVEVVPGSERERHEARGRRDGPPNFLIRDRLPDGRFVPASPAEEYWPITYCEPAEGNEVVFGYNLLTSPTRDILRRAAGSGESLGTQAFPLAQERGDMLGWIMVSPVFLPEDRLRTDSPRRHKGFVQVVFRIEDMIRAVVGEDVEQPVRWIIRDESPDALRQLLYSHAPGEGMGASPEEVVQQTGLTVEQSFEFRGRTWKLILAPSSEWFAGQKTLFPYAILALGLCLTAVLQMHVMALMRRADTVESQVFEKTAELSETNRRLSDEASARARVQEHLEMVLRGADVGTWEIQLDTGTMTFSERLATMLGFDPSEPDTDQAWWFERVHPEDREESRRAMDEHLAGRFPQIEIIHRCRRKDGDHLWVLDRGAVVERDSSGQPVRIAGTRLDINDRTLAEVRALRLATAVEQATEAIVLLDREGKIEFINRAFASRLALPEAEIHGKPFDEIWPPSMETGSGGFAAIAVAVRDQGVWRGTFNDLARGGQSCAEQVIVSAVTDPKGLLLGHVVVARDITRETELEEQVRQSQKMEAVGLLAGGVAHDFNNLLQIIRGYAALAAESGSVSEQRGHLQLVLDAVDRASQLTRQLLAFGRRQALQRTAVDFGQMTGEMLKMIRRLIPENIEITSYAAPEPLGVRCDRGQIEQVLLNLCVNARDAMPSGGRLLIHVDPREIDAASAARHDGVRPGRYARLRVVDTGMGMDAATLARIFEPFFSTKAQDRGTGLGLSVVYGIVRQHDGYIEVTSQPGKGTSFSVHLPLAGQDTAAQVATVPVPPTIEPGDGTVLLVEDEPPVRELAMRVLKRAGYRVITAANGTEACEIFACHAEEIDLVVMDMIMPKMGGREAFQRIHALRPGTPVLFCSGYSNEGHDGSFELPPGTSLLAKPYLPGEFTAQIARMIREAKARLVAT